MQKIKLNSNVKDYVVDMLSYNNDVCEFARVFLRGSFPQCYAILPAFVCQDKAEKIAEGGIIDLQHDFEKAETISSSDVTSWLAEYLFEKINAGGLFCIFDDVMASASDVEDFREFAVFRERGVFHVACKYNTRTVNDLIKIIYASKVSWHFVCAIALPSADAHEFLGDQIEINDSSMKVQEIVLGAYDGESFIILSKN
ncbi:hypothetical protein ABC502_18600 [Alkalimonas sp. NCh-2]|uniref:hypothetical protein n=1 Tax=Alkalimonas sp. NCh-2 TaxID=3144846 RepID=UPI0031F6A772